MLKKEPARQSVKEGSAAAAARLKAWEDEKSQLEATLRRLRARLERGRVRISEEVFADAIERLKGNLPEGSTQERRGVLRTFVQKIEVGKKRGTLYYTFPLYALALDEVAYLESTPGGVQNKRVHPGTRPRLRVAAQYE